MTQFKSTVTAAATGVSLLASILLLHAQEVTDVPVTSSSPTSTAAGLKDKISETVSGVQPF